MRQTHCEWPFGANRWSNWMDDAKMKKKAALAYFLNTIVLKLRKRKASIFICRSGRSQELLARRASWHKKKQHSSHSYIPSFFTMRFFSFSVGMWKLRRWQAVWYMPSFFFIARRWFNLLKGIDDSVSSIPKPFFTTHYVWYMFKTACLWHYWMKLLFLLMD